jgi:hypothetical protein
MIFQIAINKQVNIAQNTKYKHFDINSFFLVDFVELQKLII